jgi:hypothetical protein
LFENVGYTVLGIFYLLHGVRKFKTDYENIVHVNLSMTVTVLEYHIIQLIFFRTTGTAAGY